MTGTTAGRRGMLVLLLVVLAAPANSYLTSRILGRHIDRITDQGIKMLFKWKQQFVLDSLVNITDVLEQRLGDFHPSVLPNITAYITEGLANATDKLDQVDTILDDWGLTDEGDGLVTYSNAVNYNEVNVGGHFDASNRATGTFTAPMAGLYHLTLKSVYESGSDLELIRNGDTISSLKDEYYTYGIKMRTRIIRLDKDDEIYVTGNINTFVLECTLLRRQFVLPEFL